MHIALFKSLECALYLHLHSQAFSNNNVNNIVNDKRLMGLKFGELAKEIFISKFLMVWEKIFWHPL